jgi:type IV secretion system protein VirB10
MNDANEQDTTKVDLSPPDFAAWGLAPPGVGEPLAMAAAPSPASSPTADLGGVGAPPAEHTRSEMTFATKLPPDHPGLQLERPQPRTLKRGPVLAAAGALAGIVGLAAIIALSPRGEQAKAATPTLPDGPAKTVSLPDTLKNAPGNDSDLHPPPQLGPPLHGAQPPAKGGAPLAPEGHSTFASSSRRDEQGKVRASPILVDLENPTQDSSPVPPVAAQLPGPPAATQPAAGSSGLSSAGGDPNLQQHKSDFLSRDGVNTSSYLNQPLVLPRSPYEVKAGTIIPTTLITGINSDLPGQIIGQVRENVYDTVTGEYLLVPQGSRLVATYDSAVAFGQDRVLVCWNRLIRPDGISISLECMPGVDLAGYSGFADEVDHHWWRILSGVAIGTLLSATAEKSQGNVAGYNPTMPQLWASNAGGAINQAGQQITQKNLAIQPTIRVRPGFSVNVIVTKDIVLLPYKP